MRSSLIFQWFCDLGQPGPRHRTNQDNDLAAQPGRGTAWPGALRRGVYRPFYDFVITHEGQWKVLHRKPIDEKDHLDPVDSTAT